MAEPSASNIGYPLINGNSEVNSLSNIKSEASKIGDELHGLNVDTVTTSQTSKTGQPLTHYHSLLYSLLSWERPRATAVSFGTVIAFILAARFLPLLSWGLRILYTLLGLIAAIEIAGQLILSHGLASSFRPRKYYTIPKDTFDGVLEDLEQLVDFFLIEFQRILFAEKISRTIATFTAAFLSYWLIKILPFWIFTLLAVSVTYLGPLVYVSNRDIIDEQIEIVQEIINTQTNHVRDIAGQQTAQAKDLMKQYVSDYSTKAQEYMGARRSASPELARAPPVIKAEPSPQSYDFPPAPKGEPRNEHVDGGFLPEPETELEPEPDAILSS